MVVLTDEIVEMLYGYIEAVQIEEKPEMQTKWCHQLIGALDAALTLCKYECNHDCEHCEEVE